MSCGLDWSMTCPAACAWIGGKAEFWYAHATPKTLVDVTSVLIPEYPDHDLRTIARAKHLATTCVAWLRNFGEGIVPVVIEDYAFNATGRVYHIGENAGLMKYVLGESGYRVHVVSPTVVKKFATGRGNADKHKMTAAFLDAYPPARTWIRTLFPRFVEGDSDEARSPLADLADAYWIARYAASPSFKA